MTGVTVRQAALADLDALAPLFDGYRQFYGQSSDLPGARKFLLERFERGESVIFIAEMGDSAIGFTQLYPSFSSVSMARIFILNDLFVAPHGRGHGAGKGLLNAAAQYARSVGAVRLTLATAVTNVPAQTLYESAGWQRDEEFYVYNLPTRP
jgi:GNAT superfamily N-acetyltransferase